MKTLFRISLPILLIVNVFLAACDQGEVLVDNLEAKVYNDTLRVFKCIPDSILFTFTTTSDWSAAVSRGGDWCNISLSSGTKGQNSFIISVDENTSVEMRQTSIILESGNVRRIFKVIQEAGEYWFDTYYWNRTNAQRMGIRHKVKTMTLSNNKDLYTNTYFFDERGNLLKHEYQGIGFTRNDTIRLYEYDSENHRVKCVVLNHDGTVVREYGYEYNNRGAYVAYDQNGWLDQNPLAEDLGGCILPDLSAVFKTWNEGGVEFHEDRTYTFVDEYKLEIIIDRWKEYQDERVQLGRDTMKVSYQYYNVCSLSLPSTSRMVNRTYYYKNAMVKTFDDNNGLYELLDNCHMMVISSYNKHSDTDSQVNDVEWYNITYNYNRDILEREIKYSGYNLVIDRYTKYQYDNCDNWGFREEDIMSPGSSEPFSCYSRRDFVYY